MGSPTDKIYVYIYICYPQSETGQKRIDIPLKKKLPQTHVSILDSHGDSRYKTNEEFGSYGFAETILPHRKPPFQHFTIMGKVLVLKLKTDLY